MEATVKVVCPHCNLELVKSPNGTWRCPTGCTVCILESVYNLYKTIAQDFMNREGEDPYFNVVNLSNIVWEIGGRKACTLQDMFADCLKEVRAQCGLED